MRNKLLQAREIEKTYQAEQGTNQTEATSKFLKELKKLDIKSITDYHKLIKDEGYKGRNIKVVYPSENETTTKIKYAITNEEDTLIMPKATRDLIYVGDLNNLGNRINKDYCDGNDIPFVEYVFKDKDNHPWLSVAGNYSAVLVLKTPVNMSVVIKKIREAIKNAFKIQFNIDIEYFKGDGFANGKKICGSALQTQIGEMKLTPIGISLKENESKADLVFPRELRNPSQNVPTSAENILGREVNTEEFIACFIEELSKTIESEFYDY